MLNEDDYTILYPKVKSCVIKYECGGNEDLFDEDIFHETAIKCLQIMRGKWIGVPQEDIIKYFCRAYKNNFVRDKLYFRNSKESKLGETKIDSSSMADYKQCIETLDVSIISKEIQKKFPKEIEMLFYKHICENVSINDLEKEFGVKNLKYKFNKIKDFLKGSKILQEIVADYFN